MANVWENFGVGEFWNFLGGPDVIVKVYFGISVPKVKNIKNGIDNQYRLLYNEFDRSIDMDVMIQYRRMRK